MKTKKTIYVFKARIEGISTTGLKTIAHGERNIKILRKNGEKFSLNDATRYFYNTEKITVLDKNGKVFKEMTVARFSKTKYFRNIYINIYKK